MLWYGFIFLSCSVHKVHISLSHPRAFCCRNTNHHWDLKLKFVGVFPQGTIKIAPQNWFQTRVITCTPRSKNPFEEQKSNAVESFLSDDSCTRLKFCLPFFSLQSFIPCLLFFNIQLLHQFLLLRVLACHLHLLVHYIPLQLWYFSFQYSDCLNKGWGKKSINTQGCDSPSRILWMVIEIFSS